MQGCKTKHQKFSMLWALALAIVALVASPPQAAWGQAQCNADVDAAIDLGATPGPFSVGSTVRISLDIGAGGIVSAANVPGGNLEINRVEYDLDCFDDGGITCADDGLAVSYEGNLATDCVNGSAAAIIWNVTHNAGDTTPNEVEFTPSNGPVVTAANDQCNLSFDVEVQALGGNDTDGPLVIDSAGGFDNTDADCDVNDLSAGDDGTVAIQLVVNCEVTLEKDVSCDGESTFEESCISWNTFDGMPAEDVTVRYRTTNTGDAGTSLQNCVLTDDNTAITAPAVSDASIEGIDESDDRFTDACSDDLALLEPDEGMVLCDCFVGTTNVGQVSDDDDAAFDCQTPGLSITKACEDPDGEGVHPVDILVTNEGLEATLVDCVVSDDIFLDDPACPADVGVGTPVPLTGPELGSTGTLAVLLPGQTLLFSGAVGPLATTACNTATVTCTIDGTDKPITSNANAECSPLGDGCLTRTPGFWGTHPHVTELYLPLTSCGLSVDGTDANLAVSATEDMCVSGVDAKANDTSMPQLQLVRQCMAANLNVAATLALEGDCESEVQNLTNTIAECCNGVDSVCNSGSTAQEIGDSDCIERLDAFNNLPDTLLAAGPFVNPGPANSEECREANGNGFVNPGRDLGFKECTGKKCN